MTETSRYVGIDVSQQWLDVGVRPADGPAQRVANDAAGIETLVRQLAALAPARIVLEATGGLERPWSRLWSASPPTQPRQRPMARQTQRLGRSRHGPRRTLHGCPRRHPPQPCDRRLLPAPARAGQAQEGRAHRLYAQTAGHPQEQYPLASTSTRLTSKTVALPSASPPQGRERGFWSFQRPPAERGYDATFIGVTRREGLTSGSAVVRLP